MRTRSKSGYYHVMLRGNEKKNIFLDEEDKLRFIETVYRMKKEERFYLHAFCLMDNHIHMMLSEGKEDIAKIIKRITVSYVFYFNKKYERTGHLFQDRFKSEVINKDSYLFTLSRYIHQNPVKAGMAKEPGDYRWSSYNGYLGIKEDIYKGLDTSLLLGMFSEDEQKAKLLFINFMKKKNDDVFLDIEEKDKQLDDKRAKELYQKMIMSIGLTADNVKIVQIPAELLVKYQVETNLSIRKMAGITGLNKDMLSRILRKNIH